MRTYLDHRDGGTHCVGRKGILEEHDRELSSKGEVCLLYRDRSLTAYVTHTDLSCESASRARFQNRMSSTTSCRNGKVAKCRS